MAIWQYDWERERERERENNCVTSRIWYLFFLERSSVNDGFRCTTVLSDVFEVLRFLGNDKVTQRSTEGDARIRTYTGAWISALVHLHIDVHRDTHTDGYTYIYIYTRTNTHTPPHTYIRTHMYTHIHKDANKYTAFSVPFSYNASS